MRRKLSTLVAGLLLAALQAAPAGASLLGDQIIITGTVTDPAAPLGPPLTQSVTATVDTAPGAPDFSLGFPGIAASFVIDFFDGPAIGGSTDAIRIALDLGNLLGESPTFPITFPVRIALTFSDLDWVDGPGAVTSVTRVGGSPGALEDIFFGADFIALSMGPPITIASTTLEAEFRYTATHIIVPEPSAFALFGIGLLGLGVLSRRRKSA